MNKNGSGSEQSELPTKEQMKKRAIYEIEMLLETEQRERNSAEKQLRSVISRAVQLEKFLDDPKYKSEFLHQDTLMWIGEDLKRYNKSMSRIEETSRTKDSLRNTLAYLKAEVGN